MLYIIISLLWVLQRASKTIMLCALDEMKHDPDRLTHAPPELRAMLRQYMGKRLALPSLWWSWFVMLMFELAISILDALAGEQGQALHFTLCTVSAVMAIAV